MINTVYRLDRLTCCGLLLFKDFNIGYILRSKDENNRIHILTACNLASSGYLVICYMVDASTTQ